MPDRPSSSSSPRPPGSPGPRSSSRSLAASLGLFLLKLAILVPLLFALWGNAQPWYSAAVTRATNILIGVEEMGGRVTTLRPAGSLIEVWSALRHDGKPAYQYNGDMLHFYLVLCVGLCLAFPRPTGPRRLLVVAAVLGGSFLFHVMALLVTVENTYANALVVFAHRNYSPSESMVYRWLYQSFAYLAVQLVPAAVLVILFTRYGGFRGGGLSALTTEPGPAGDERPPPAAGGKGWMRWAAMAFSGAALVLLAMVMTMHIGKVHARRAEDLCQRGFDVLARSPEEAASLFAASIALKPSFLEAHDGEGAALLAAGHAARAVDAYLEALKIDSRYLASRSGLADSLARLGRDDDAISEYGKAQELSPDRWETYYNRAFMLLRQKRFAEAEADLRRTVELNPSMADAHYRLARILLMSNRLCEALPHFEAYLKMEPGSRDAPRVRNEIDKGKKECARGIAPLR